MLKIILRIVYKDMVIFIQKYKRSKFIEGKFKLQTTKHTFDMYNNELWKY